MSDYGRSASRGAQTGTLSTPGRTRLGRQHWQDIRRARKLGAEGELHSVEIHGVKLTFRFQRSCCGAGQAKAMPRAAQVGQAAGGGTASAQSPPSTPTGSPDKRRPRRRTRVQGSTRTSKLEDARTIAGENAGRTRHAPAGETAGAGTASAQSASVCSPRRRNSRQRRTANRLVEFIRIKQAQQTAAAESPQTAAPERASPKRTHEDGVHESGGGSNSTAGGVESSISTLRRGRRQLQHFTQLGGNTRWPPPLIPCPSARSNTTRRRAAGNVAEDSMCGYGMSMMTIDHRD